MIRFKKYASITLGCVLFAAAFDLFLTPNQIAPGGVSGLSVLLHFLTGLPVGAGILLLNLPLFFFGARRLPRGFLSSTVYATLLSSLLTDAFSALPPLTPDPMLAAVYGGVCLGLSMGLIFRAGATTGGTDILGRLIRKRFPRFPLGRILLLLDSAVLLLSAAVFRDLSRALYALIAVYLNARLIDLLLYGAGGQKLVYIISARSGRIAQRIVQELSRGVTLLSARGGYSGAPLDVILCALESHENDRVSAIAREEDENAFCIIVNAQKVEGLGFRTPEP